MSTQPSNPPPKSERSRSPTLSPNDHLRTLVELLRPGGADLARRWVAALFLPPEQERERIVEAVEARIVELYALEEPADKAATDEEQTVDLVEPPVEKEGHVEQVIHTYSRAADDALAAKRKPQDKRKQA